jgi:hypothetical protein
MASTYSDLKIELIGTGEQTGTWGTTTNDNFSIAIGEAITGSADVAFSSADVTLTLTNTNASQAARNLRLNLTGTSGGARNLILGSGCQIDKLYLINNGLADAVTVKNTSGTGIVVPAGKSMFVFNNATNVVEATSGDIFGPASSTDNAVARFDGTTGKAIQNSVVTIADSTGDMAGVGTLTLAAGTVSAPAITTTGDTNTGIFFPAADTIAFTEGGAESMRITSAGDVGIGTSSPSGGSLTVQSKVIQMRADGDYIRFNNAADSSYNARISQSATDFEISNRQGGALKLLTSDIERMRITSAGDVAIGITSASHRLHVYDSTNATVMYANSGSTGVYLRLGNSANQGGYIGYEGTGGTNMTFYTSATEKMRIGSNGNIGIGTTATDAAVNIYGTNGTASSSTTFWNLTYAGMVIRNSSDTANTVAGIAFQGGSGGGSNSAIGNIAESTSLGALAFYTGGSGRSNTVPERMRIDSSGNVGIGTTNPSQKFVVSNNGAAGLEISPTAIASAPCLISYNRSGAAYTQLSYSALQHVWDTSSTERMRLTSSGNLSVGAGTNPSSKLAVTTGTASSLICSFSDGVAQTLQIGTETSGLYFNNSNSGYQAFQIGGTERMRIDSSGNLLVGKTFANQIGDRGFEANSVGVGFFTSDGETCLNINRKTNDGVLVQFWQDTVAEGNISVSGSTVSYNGGHLSRWSQLLDGSKDNTILKGTVMSNLDDMCVWEKDGVIAENEQLNKMKVSDVEGDTNVAGVFVNWTIDADYGVDDMNVAMTGDMIIRIADGVVVQKGDLLMSAGDGTAKPQGDDIVRSKTIAKVTSNYVTCTYADGSYCVPCVLMAC